MHPRWRHLAETKLFSNVKGAAHAKAAYLRPRVRAARYSRFVRTLRWRGVKEWGPRRATALLSVVCSVVVSCAAPEGTPARRVDQPAPSSTARPTTPTSTTSAPPPAGTPWQYPLLVGPGGRYLVDGSGRPFRVQGDTGWEASTEVALDGWRTYLDDRKARGFNTILMQMTSANNNYAGSKSPAAVGAGGALPFLRNAQGGTWDGDPQFAGDLGKHNPAPGNFDADFSSPNPAYWNWIHRMVEEANQRNILMILTVAYLGYNQGAQDGWWRTLNNADNTRDVSFGFGRFIGDMFKDLPNIIWEMGVDMVPPAGSEGEARALAILKGVKEAGDTHLWTAHWVHDVLGTDSAAFAPFVDIEGVYTHGPYPQLGPTYGRARQAYERQPAKPAILLETTYENNQDATRADIRGFMWGAALSGSGVIFGSTPVWLFMPGWQDGLETPGTRDMQQLGVLMDSLPWKDLVPVGLDSVPDPIVKGHGSYTSMRNVGDSETGGMDWIVPAMTRDRRHLVAYVPPAHSGDFTVDMGAMAAPAQVTWVDPTSGATQDVGLYENAGMLKLQPPGNNGGQAGDWLLVVNVA